MPAVIGVSRQGEQRATIELVLLLPNETTQLLFDPMAAQLNLKTG